MIHIAVVPNAAHFDVAIYLRSGCAKEFGKRSLAAVVVFFYVLL
jgi:hypothetical protein